MVSEETIKKVKEIYCNKSFCFDNFEEEVFDFKNSGLKRTDFDAQTKSFIEYSKIFLKDTFSSDMVVYLLQDGSGSFYGKKSEIAAIYHAILEELSVNNFYKSVLYQAMDNVKHLVINDFDDDEKNAVYFSKVHKRLMFGENFDGCSIRIATNELLELEKESNKKLKKVLIYVNDGQPNFKGHRFQQLNADIIQAINVAKRNSVKVLNLNIDSLNENQAVLKLLQELLKI